MAALKYIYFGSPEIASHILESLCENFGKPVCVVTQPAKKSGRGQKEKPTPVQEVAEKIGLPVLAVASANEKSVLEKIKAYSPDLLVVVAFGQLLSDALLKIPKIFAINLHASLLPKYRGAAPVQYAILNREEKTGITIQKIVKELDAGDILLQKEFVLNPDATTGSVWELVAVEGAKLCTEALKKISSGKYELTPQDKSKASFAPKLKRDQGKIDWNKPSIEIEAQVRAFQPWPVAETVFGEERLLIHKALFGKSTGKPAGAVYSDGKSFLEVGCGDGQSLALSTVQRENKKKVGVVEFLASLRGNLPKGLVQ